MEKDMDRGWLNIGKEEVIEESLRMIKKVDRENKFMRMTFFMKDHSKMI